MATPERLPTWATDENYSNDPSPGTPTKLDPGAALQDEGWLPGYRPPAQMFNWWKNLVGKWITYLHSLRLANWWVHSQKSGFTPESQVLGTRNIACLSVAPDDGVEPWVMVDANTFLSSHYGVAWSAASHTSIGGLIVRCVHSTGTAILVVTEESGGGPYIRRTVDGVTWTDPTAPVATTITDLADNGEGVVVGGCGTTTDGFIRSDDDGATWSSVDSGQANPVAKIVWNGSFFVAVGGGFCIRSSTGTSWFAVTAPGDNINRGFAANLRTGTIIGTVGSSDTMYRSKDHGDTWEEIAAPGISGDAHMALCCAEGLWVLLRGNGSAAAYGGATQQDWQPMHWSDDDGDTWHRVNGLQQALISVAYGQGMFLATGVDPTATDAYVYRSMAAAAE